LKPDARRPCRLPKCELYRFEFDGDQIQVISNLYQSFTEGIGGLNQNPNDPAYFKHWQKAQTKADGLLEGIWGWTALPNFKCWRKIRPPRRSDAGALKFVA
jgi:hypothetical protein